uniref:Transposase n=1 Tax=Panagrolaimus davidi TaxID=227884 RepID=A0A914PZF5_9BILA
MFFFENDYNFMIGNQKRPQNNTALQFLQPTFNLPPLSSTSSLDSGTPTMSNSLPAQTLSNDGGSVKEETRREVFFRTLSSSLKEANKFYSIHFTAYESTIDNNCQDGNTFEIPRQQEEEIREPEIMHFKSSQTLLNPNNTTVDTDKMNPRNIAEMVADNFASLEITNRTQAERSVSEKIITEITKICEANTLFEKTYEREELFLENCDYDECQEEFEAYDQYYYDYSEDDCPSENEGDALFEPPVKICKLEEISPEQIEKALIFYRGTKKGTRSVSSMSSKFRWIKTRADIDNILLKYEQEKEPNRVQKLKSIDEGLIKIFAEKLSLGLPIHDLDIRAWALKINNDLEHPLKNFKASYHYIKNFKNRKHEIDGYDGQFRIRNRKVTHEVSRIQLRSADKTLEAANEFVEMIKTLKNNYEEAMIFNCDQSGFKKEMHSGYTLAPEGVRKVTITVQSTSATSHSYTIMPILSMNGVFLPLLYILIQESTGHFPPTKKIYTPPNIFADTHTSSMMTKNNLAHFLDNVYFKLTGEKSLLLADSWSAWADKSMIAKHIPHGKDFKLQIMPPGTTSMIQPLDVGIFKSWKKMDRRICDYALLHDIDYNIHDRESIMKRQSFIHYQFCAPRFIPFNKKSWIASGYISEETSACLSPAHYCFSVDDENCTIYNCKITPFARCAHCEYYFCFEHCILNLHFCKQLM